MSISLYEALKTVVFSIDEWPSRPFNVDEGELRFEFPGRTKYLVTKENAVYVATDGHYIHPIFYEDIYTRKYKKYSELVFISKYEGRDARSLLGLKSKGGNYE